ncbi:MAG: hypothetical protein GY828_07465 [Candidatus Gracilibacteria bacterium]|nr:hypothetical protein [Candidatus Gracilibacteria bacterium]
MLYGLSKYIEYFYRKELDKSLFGFILLSKRKISENIDEKLFHGNLVLSDIFCKINDKNGYYGEYNISIQLDSFIESMEVIPFGQGGNYSQYYNTRKRIGRLHSIELFNYNGKNNLNLNEISMLNNKYTDLQKYLLPIFSKNSIYGKTKIFYKLSYVFSSTVLPVSAKEMMIKIDIPYETPKY